MLVVVLVYLGALVAVGAAKARSVRTQADFSLAGRRLSTFVLVGTLLATWIGTGSIFGLAEEAYVVGLPSLVIPLAEVAGIAVLFAIAGRARRTEKVTVQDILEERFGPAARILGTLTLAIAYVVIVSYQYRAGAAVLERILPEGIPGGHATAVGAVALFVVLYTALAGMISVAYTDVANGILMTAGVAIALPILLAKAGGWSEVTAALEPSGRALFGHYSFGGLLAVTLPSFLLLLGDANLLTRFFSARDARTARRATVALLVGVFFLETAIMLLAIAGRALLPGLQNPAHVVLEASFRIVHPALGALLVATIVAIVVSTADSYLLAPSSSIARDVYQRFVRPDAPERELVLAGRIFVVILGAVALALAFQSEEFFSVARFAYTIYGVGVTPVLLAALFVPRASPRGAVAAMGLAVSTAIAWRALGLEGTTGLHPVIPGFAISSGILLATLRR